MNNFYLPSNANEALEKIRSILEADKVLYLLDGVDTTDGYGNTEPWLTNWKTRDCVNQLDVYARRHPELDTSGVDLIEELMKLIVSAPTLQFPSTAERKPEPAWVFKRWIEAEGFPFVGSAYMKVFRLETGLPVIGVHLE